MQKNGKFKLSDRISNKTNSDSVGVGRLMRECSIYGETLRQIDANPREHWAKQREAEDARIVADYWAKKEELELLYKMRDGRKKQDLIDAKKAELDQMYKRYVCVRKAVWAKKQARNEVKRNVGLRKLSLDLYNLPGRTMNQRECDEFLDRVGELVPITKVMANDGGWVLGFEFEGTSYYPVKTKNGVRWEVAL